MRGLVYPVPDPAFPFLGVHLTRGTDGTVHVGPNAVPALAREGYDWGTVRPAELGTVLAWPGAWRVAGRHWRYGAGELHRSLSKRAFTEAVRRLLPAVEETDLRRSCGRGAGPGGPQGRHAGRRLPDPGGAAHGPCAERPSPAATAALPIGREIARRALASVGVRA